MIQGGSGLTEPIAGSSDPPGEAEACDVCLKVPWGPDAEGQGRAGEQKGNSSHCSFTGGFWGKTQCVLCFWVRL